MFRATLVTVSCSLVCLGAAATASASDTTPPIISSYGGSAFAGGWKGGTFSGYANVSDPESGVRQVRFEVDDVPLPGTTNNFLCDYAMLIPCPIGPQANFNVDTTQVPDGEHDVRILAIDAFDNARFSSRTTVQWDNTAPVAPSGLTGTANGSFFYVEFTPPGNQAAPLTHVDWDLCPQAGGSCLTLEGGLNLNPQGKAALAWGQVPAGAYDITVRVRDAAGHWSAPSSPLTLTSTG